MPEKQTEIAQPQVTILMQNESSWTRPHTGYTKDMIKKEKAWCTNDRFSKKMLQTYPYIPFRVKKYLLQSRPTPSIGTTSMETHDCI